MRWEGLELAGSGMLKGTGLTGRGITVPATWNVVCRATGKKENEFQVSQGCSTGWKKLFQELELGCES